MDTSTPPSLTLVNTGPNDRASRIARLLDKPEAYDSKDFFRLCKEFGFSYVETEWLFAKRLRRQPASLERHALLAIVEGDHDESDRLLELMKRRNALSLRVI